MDIPSITKSSSSLSKINKDMGVLLNKFNSCLTSAENYEKIKLYQE